MTVLQDIDAERAALAAAMLGGDVELAPDDFTSEWHREIAKAIEMLKLEGARPDAVLVRSKVGEQAARALIDVVACAVAPSQGKRYMRRVSELAARRRAMDAAKMVQALAERGDDWLPYAEQLLDVASSKSVRATMRELAKEAEERLAKPRDYVRFLLTGPLHFHFGDLAIIGARPGVGKSALAAQWAVELAEKGLPTRIYSLEMKRDDWLDRVVAQRTGISVDEMDRGLAGRGLELAKQALEAVEALPLTVLDDAAIGLAGIVADVRRFARAGGRAVFIDYLQLVVSSAKHKSRYEAVSEASRVLKLLAHDTGVLLVALSQLNRSPVADGRNRPPGLADLRDSGSLEQDADDVLLLHRYGADDEAIRETLRKRGFVLEDDEHDGGTQALCHIHAAKMRRGRTAIQYVWFDGPSQTFGIVDQLPDELKRGGGRRFDGGKADAHPSEPGSIPGASTI